MSALRTRLASFRSLGLAALGALASCQAPAAPTPVHGEAAAPTVDAARHDLGAWEYMRREYDADGDGVVTAAEYRRGEERFGYLDQDGDGVLEEEDFGAIEEEGSEILAMLSGRKLFEYFQEEGEDFGSLEELTLDELFVAAGAYDADHDDVIREAEFRALAYARRKLPGGEIERMMGERDPWETLLGSVDADADGALGFDELGLFFEERDDGDFVLILADSEPVEASGPRTGAPATGPRVGTPAPDFTLAPPDGGETVTLSSFRGERPVALVFGSYT